MKEIAMTGYCKGLKTPAWCVLSVATVALIAACGGGSGDSSLGNTADGSSGASCTAANEAAKVVEPYAPAVVAAKAEAAPASLRVPRAAEMLRTVRLGALAGTDVTGTLPNGLRQIGVARVSAQTSNVAATASMLKWKSLEDGSKVATLSFRSVDAKGIRLGLLVEQLAPNAVLRFYAQGAGTAFAVTGSEVLAQIQQNLSAGDTSPEAHTYWAPAVGTDEVTLDIELPTGVDPAALRIAVPRLSHFVVAPHAETSDIVAKIGEAGTCEADVSCQASYSGESNAVARMSFVNGGKSYLCTGTLLNDAASSGTPYFLSANHCISTQTVASTLTTDWFYRSSSCNSTALTTQAKTLTGGATLLFASSETDTSFMRLNTSPPSGAVYAGWSAGVPATGMPAADVHHPRGDLQKLSLGSIRGFSICTSATSDSYECSGATSGTGKHLVVGWSSGVTEAGSSGSGVFATMNGRRYLVGQLTGGGASCTATGGSDYFGRFDLAYTAALSRWLAATGSSNTCKSAAAS